MVPRDSIVDREAKARACEEVLSSRTLARSEQLAQFLRYICGLEIEGRGSEITEYSIATNALNRPADYAPGEDSSVRSRAHALRRKLQEYYELEAAEAEVRIELPKGSYRPAFVSRNAQQAPESKIEPPVRKRVKPWWVLAASVALLALAGAIAFAVYRPDPIDPIVRAAWGPILRRGSDVQILISGPPMVRFVPSAPGVKPHGRLPELAPDWAVDWYNRLNLEDRGGPLYLAPSRGYSVFSDSLAAMTVSSLIGRAGASYHAMPEYAVQPRALHEAGLVVIGSPAYTPFLARLLKAMPYSIWFDAGLNNEVMGLKSGAAGGQVYTPKRNPQTIRYSTVYGLITVLPSQPGQSRPERMLVFAGFTGSPGAQAAIDYFSSPASLRDLKERFRGKGYSTFPPAYQVVVRCGVDNETAINVVYETHVVLSSVPVIE